MGSGRTQRSVNFTFHLEQNAASHPKKGSAGSSVSKPRSNGLPLESKRRNTGCDCDMLTSQGAKSPNCVFYTHTAEE